MPRIARVVVVGYPHHITQRGNYRQDIFIDDGDRRKYLNFVKLESSRYGLELLAYCLMSNHVHFIGVPKQSDSISQVFKYVNMKYSQYFHRRTKAGTGHLWQGRFFSCVMDESYLIACARYIERNPVRSKMVKKPWQWNWSTARVHCGLEAKDFLGVNRLFEYTDESRKGWKEFIDDHDLEGEMKAIKEHTLKGRPLGEEGFIGKLEKRLGRMLRLKPRGRPKQQRLHY